MLMLNLEDEKNSLPAYDGQCEARGEEAVLCKVRVNFDFVLLVVTKRSEILGKSYLKSQKFNCSFYRKAVVFLGEPRKGDAVPTS